MKLLLITLFVVAVAMAAVSNGYESSEEEDCPENEKWSSCSKKCEWTCERELIKRAGKSDKCASSCYPGCICESGMARSGDGCVKKEDC